MSVVIDANVILTAGTEASLRGDAARDRLERWRTAGEDVHAPQLFPYEVASGLRGLEAAGKMSPRVADDALRMLDALDVTLHPPPGASVLIAIARRIQQTKAYDAAYIDVALEMPAELWTLDRRLARSARSAGFPVTLLV